MSMSTERSIPAGPSCRHERAAPPHRGRRHTLKRLLAAIGPGVITGASDDDPSGIGTYAVAGARLGYAALWTAPVTFPLTACVQYICAKIGLVSGHGIGAILRLHYPRALLYAVVGGLLLANTINAGADLLAIAAGLNLLVPVPIMGIIAPIALAILVVQIWGSYRWIARIFMWLTLALFAYIGSALCARPDWSAVVRGTLMPEIRFDRTYLATLLAILGTTISPYLFFWQASQEVEERISRTHQRRWRRREVESSELTYARIDVGVGIFFSSVVMFSIILGTAATLHASGQRDIDSAADAAEALRPLAGNAATVLMALGLVGTGLLAVPILTASASYAVCEAVGWKCSLDATPARAKEFYIVLTLSTFIALLIDFIGIKPMVALFWTAVINGILSAPLLVVIMLIANNRKVMKEDANGLGLNILGWTTAALMFAAGIGVFLTL